MREAKTLLSEHFVVKVRKITAFDYGSISHRKRVVIVCIRRGSAYENDFEMHAPTWGGERKACANNVAVSDETALAIMDTKYVYSGDLVTRYDLQEGHVTEDPARWIPTSQPTARPGEMVKLGRVAKGMGLSWRPHLALCREGAPVEFG